MKHLIVSILLVITSNFLIAQEEGIHFEKGSWSEIQAKAQAENKPIYVDVFTTWCGPCKMLARDYFPNKEVGKKYNALFINYKIDAEKGEGIELAKQFEVMGYPTGLFIRPDGETLFFKNVGVPASIDLFIQKADIAMIEYADPMDYDEYMRKYATGNYDAEFLMKLIQKNKNLEKNNDIYLDTYISKYRGGNQSLGLDTALSWYIEYMPTASSQLFDYVYSQRESISNPPEFLEEYFQRSAYASWEKASMTEDLNSMRQMEPLLNSLFAEPNYVLMEGYANYYRTKKDKENLKKVYLLYGNKMAATSQEALEKEDAKNLHKIKEQLASQLSSSEISADSIDYYVDLSIKLKPEYASMSQVNLSSNLNSLCWNIYEHYSDDTELVHEATKWAAKAYDLSKISPSLTGAVADTYAHLLDVDGQSQKAYQIQGEAVKAYKKMGMESEEIVEFYNKLKSKVE